MSIGPSQRFKRSRPCPICGGGDDMPRGHQKRCSGFISSDGAYAHCSRDELASGLEQEDGGTFAHRMHGQCRCGVQHGPSDSGVYATNPREPIATYDYADENGAHLFQVAKFLDGNRKTFRQRRLVAGQWIWDTKGVRRTLYRLKDLVSADPTKTVFIVEGEKDVETMWKLGQVATCNPGGSGKWPYVEREAQRVLAGRTVIIVADADSPGRSHARDVAKSLDGIAKSVSVREAPSPCKDVSEFIEAGGTLADLLADKPIPPNPAWNLLDLTELSKPLPPVPWVCESLGLAPGAVSLVAGYGYSRKTMALQSLGLSVAAGLPIWGVFRGRQGPFVHLDYEQGRRLTQERTQRLARGMGFDLRDLPPGTLRVACMPRVYLDEKDIADELMRLVDGAAFVLVDSLRAAFPHADENSSEVRSYLDVLSRVSERTGALFDVIHHARKPSKEDKEGATFAIRGSSALFDACQSVHVFIGEKDTPTMVHHQKDRIRGACADTFGLTGEDVALNGDPRWGLRVVHLEPEQLEVAEKIKQNAKFERIIRAVEITLRKSGGGFRGGKRELLDLSGVGHGNDAYDALNEAVSTGRVVRGGSYQQPEWRVP